MNKIIIIILVVLFIYFTFYKNESFENTESIDTLLNYLNSPYPQFIKYSQLLNTLKNTSEELGKKEVFNTLLEIKKIQTILIADNIKTFL